MVELEINLEENDEGIILSISEFCCPTLPCKQVTWWL
jgi:hypothetical protein